MQSIQMESIHIGNMIKAELKAQGRTVTWFAKAINTTRTNVYKILDKESHFLAGESMNLVII